MNKFYTLIRCGICRKYHLKAGEIVRVKINGLTRYASKACYNGGRSHFGG